MAKARSSGKSKAVTVPNPDMLAQQLEAALPAHYPRHALYLFGDGGCQYFNDPLTGTKKSTGPGGWGSAFLWLEPGEQPLVVYLSGGHPDTTNNQMELRALIDGLAAINDLGDLKGGRLPIYAISDSQYAIKGATEWLPGWIRRNWADVKNVQYWKQLMIARKGLEIDWRHCKGHRDPSKLAAVSWEKFTALGNDAADRLATVARSKMIAEKGD